MAEPPDAVLYLPVVNGYLTKGNLSTKGAKVKTQDRILHVSQDLLATGGLAALSFDAIARALGVSKQAVLYWFPSKPDLLAALFVPWAQDEAEVAVQALVGQRGADAAIAAFVRAIARFHLAHLDRFRLMYLVPQTLGPAADPADRAVLPQVHAATDRLYSALAACLPGAPDQARRDAVAVHSATLGLVMLLGLGQAIGDPLKHGADALTEALIARLGGAQVA